LPPVSELQEFIHASKNKGASDEFLAALLIRRGWPEDAVYSALGDYWTAVTGVAVPQRKSSAESAREAFLYLLAFSTLCCWATALGSAMFTFIDHWFPDPVVQPSYYQNIRSSVTWQMATLAVAFPIFLLVMRAILKENAANPEQLQSGVRRWLTYIALLLTAGAMISDLIWFLEALLNGEITVRFVLKSLVVMIICGAIFVYYLRSLRARATGMNLPFAVGSGLAVTAVFLIGFGVAGTPAENRLQQGDATRVRALEQLEQAIRATATVPASLAQLVQQGRIRDAQTRDPVTGRQFEFRSLGGDGYQLCATFSRASEAEGPYEVYGSAFWHHGPGRTCYALDATKLAR
jgi:hypothetical protein